MIVSGMRRPNFLMRRYFRARFSLARSLSMRVEVRDGKEAYQFDCSTYTEFKRAVTILQKEEGTIDWLRETLRPGDSFHDIGANVGIYSIFAGVRVGPSGQIAAFEPHPANTLSLMRNVVLNGFAERTKVISAALSDKGGFFPFNIREATAGSSMSQLGQTIDGDGVAFLPAMSECKVSVTLDQLVRDGIVRSPDVVKIDVDGNELLVLAGMSGVLRSSSRPRSVQVEVNHRYEDELDAFMTSHDYRLQRRHHTFAGKRKLAAGAESLAVAHNAVYVVPTS